MTVPVVEVPEVWAWVSVAAFADEAAPVVAICAVRAGSDTGTPSRRVILPV
ncbi:hypothetical protein [Streptomyces sp. NPDC007355]|uniref:hypothetical protein n=1 Tax=Streptomyces sp. NPDC007355 TaxID=3364778 RepID=UPI00369B5992